ncbi:MAG: hypothetical protein IIB75_02465 [Proteobacteria bacterium]|nr:hypothetical protein [Pseudomonadota bacterium]
MASSRQYDTVAFDVRDNTIMLFFAKTTPERDISDYLLLMRTVDDEFEETLTIEINEQQLAGGNLIREADLTGNVLTLRLHEPAAELDGATEIVLTWEDTAENLESIEAGAFRVFGDTLVGGNA